MTTIRCWSEGCGDKTFGCKVGCEGVDVIVNAWVEDGVDPLQYTLSWCTDQPSVVDESLMWTGLYNGIDGPVFKNVEDGLMGKLAL